MGHSSHRGSDRDSSVLGGSGHHGLAGGLGKYVLHIRTGDLGDSVTVLNLDRNLLDLGVVHTVLGGDLTASMLHCGSHGVGHSVSYGSHMVSHRNGGSMVSYSHRGSSIASVVAESKGSSDTVVSISISISLSLGLPLDVMVASISNRSSITQSVHNLLAHLLILNLLGSHSLSAANLLRVRSAGLGDEDDVLCYTVRSRSSMVCDRSYRSNGSMSVTKGLSISIG